MDSESSSNPIDSQALDWFVRRADGLSAAEEAAFQAWLKADQAHAFAFAKWNEEWRSFDALPMETVERLRRNLARDLIAETTQASTRHHPSSCSRSPERAGGFLAALLRPRPAMAMACVLLIIAGMFGWNYRQPVFSESYATVRGEQREIMLPDGSRLLLDTASRADVALYRGRREVRLPAGQARFEVAGNPDRPFDVYAGPLRITVIGTRFAVRYTPGMPEQDGVHVAVEEGRVQVRRDEWLAFGDAVELTAGRQVTGTATGALSDIAAVPAAGISPWSERRVSFDNASLQQVLAEFERYGDTGLVIRDPAVAGMRLTGTFDPRSPENFMRVLPQALPVRLSRAGGVVEIRSGR